MKECSLSGRLLREKSVGLLAEGDEFIQHIIEQEAGNERGICTRRGVWTVAQAPDDSFSYNRFNNERTHLLSPDRRASKAVSFRRSMS